MAAQTQISVEEYLRTSFDGTDREYLDGEIVERGMPTQEHSRAQARLIAWFAALEEKFHFDYLPELRVRVAERRYRVVDLAVFVDKPAEQVPSSPPLVAIEILSPDDRFTDVLAKLEEYQRWGVTHVWFVDPISRKLYVYSASLKEVSAFRLPEYGVEISAADIFR
jgi:Uma2 family endonuclease